METTVAARTNGTLVKCACIHCGGHVECDTETVGQIVACPHCGADTVLRSRSVAARNPRSYKGLILWSVAALALLSIAGLLYLFASKAQQALQVVGGVTGGLIGAVVVAVIGFFVLLWCVLWLLFPFVVYFGLEDLRKQSRLLNESVHQCIDRLERIAGETRKHRDS